jgi:hypothetical protein
MSYPYDNCVHYTQQSDRRLGFTVFAYFGCISFRASRSLFLFWQPEDNASRAPWIFANPTLPCRRVG